MKGYRVAVVGALGAVGTEMIKTLEQRNFPVLTLIPMDVESLAGKKVTFKGSEVAVRAAKPGAFGDVDVALFSGEPRRALCWLRPRPPKGRSSSTIRASGGWIPAFPSSCRK